jgi:pimeloyl-ACP methyl ester carboxylesterase
MNPESRSILSKQKMHRLLLARLLLLFVLTTAGVGGEPFESQLVDVGGYRLNFNVAHGGDKTILVEAGGLDDSSVWSKVANDVAQSTGATVVTYDPAGLGRSDPAPNEYKIDNEVSALDRGLTQLKLDNKPLVIVAHSYGGFLATLYAAKHPQQMRGVVLIDANLVSFFSDVEVARLMAESAGEREEMRKKAPAKAHILDALPETVKRMRGVNFPVTIPCLVIAAERLPMETPDEIAQWKRRHEEFVAVAPNRRLITATGSGHFVMRDAPHVVIDANKRFY